MRPRQCVNNLRRNGTYPNLQFGSIFGPNVPQKSTKYCPKPKFLRNNFGNNCLIQLKFGPQIVLIDIYIVHNAFSKALIFTTAGRSQNVQFWSKFGPNVSHEGGEIEESKYFEQKNYPSGNPNIQKLRLYLVSNLNEKHIYFLLFLVFFFFKKGPKYQRSRSQRSSQHPFFSRPL